MRHSSSRISADRHANGMSRSTLESADDTKLMQEVGVALFEDEKQDGVERFVQYGFTSVPQKPTGTGKMRRAAEAVFSFLGGNRSHGIAMMVGDRRYRLYKLAAGEVALHDDQGQQVHFKRDGVYVSAPNSKKIVGQIMDDDSMPQESNAKGGQIQQAGRSAAINYVIDKNGYTINHTGTVQINAPAIVLNGNVYLGGTQSAATKKASKEGTVDTAGDADIINLCPKVFMVP